MRRAVGTATLITGAAVLLLLSRSEIRKTLLATSAVVPIGVIGLWLVIFVVVWMRSRGAGR